MNPHIAVLPEFALRLLVAGALGAVIGFERQWRQRGAGLHTSALVAVGAALFALLSPVVGNESETRVLANIVTGVGFLAGGVILRQGTSVTGLNTAATIWATAAVGALAGIGLFVEAAVGAAAIVAFNFLMQPLVIWIDGHAALYQERSGNREYLVKAKCDDGARAGVRAAIVAAIEHSKLQLHALSTASTADGCEVRAEILLPRRDDQAIENLVSDLAKQAGVNEVTWRHQE